MFSDNYVNLCAARGETITGVSEKLGFSRPAGVKWASGAVPRKTTLKRIADYFGVTVEELMEEKEPAAKSGGQDELSEIMDLLEAASPQKRQLVLDLLKLP